MLETNVFHVGDEDSSAGDDCVENMSLNFSHTHTHTVASYQQHSSRTYVKMIASHCYLPLTTGGITLQRAKRYLDAQQHFPLH